MIQEIIVFLILALVVGYYVYRFFVRKNNQPTGGCSKCSHNVDSDDMQKSRN